MLECKHIKCLRTGIKLMVEKVKKKWDTKCHCLKLLLLLFFLRMFFINIIIKT